MMTDISKEYGVNLEWIGRLATISNAHFNVKLFIIKKSNLFIDDDKFIAKNSFCTKIAKYITLTITQNKDVMENGKGWGYTKGIGDIRLI